MKKKVFFMLVLLLVPLSVYADSVSIKCPSTMDSNSEFSCEVTGNSNNFITSLSAVVTTTKDVSFVSFIPDSGIWQGDGVNGQIDLYTDVDVKNNFKIGVIKLKNNGNTDSSVTIDSIFFYDINDKEIKVDSVSEVVAIKKITNNSSVKDSNTNNNTLVVDNNDSNKVYSAYLADLLIDDYVIDFNRNTFEYTIKIGDEDSLNIVPVLEDNSANVNISGNQKLTNGSVINIRVIAEDDKTLVYKLNIVKDNVSKKRNFSLIFIIIIVVLIGINVFRMVSNKKKNSDD